MRIINGYVLLNHEICRIVYITKISYYYKQIRLMNIKGYILSISKTSKFGYRGLGGGALAVVGGCLW